MDYHAYPSHRLMLRDVVRTEAFQKAIKEVVKAGDVVLDVGAGSGVLSLFAAQAGAARVYAVERTGLASLAAHLAQINGFDTAIQVLQGDIRDVRLPEKCDVIVSEWMGTLGVDENMLGAVLWARDHHLKDGGQLIPKRVTARMAPVTTSQRADIDFFGNRPYDLDLSPLHEPIVNELFMVRRRVNAEDLAAPAVDLWVSDVASDPPSTVREPYEAELKFSIEKAAKVTALGAWFHAELSPKVALSNAPDCPDTHWGQLILPLKSELALKSGDALATKVTARSVGPGPLQFSWAVRVNDGEWEHHDTMLDDASATAQAATVQSRPPLKRSALSGFLAGLAVDPALLSTFLTGPQGVMNKHNVAEAHQQALKSRDLLKINEALYEAEKDA